ncbi:flagellin [Paracoccus pacificus]|uniref:Flagellin n=1 Tax=Paracoccus pacificus TaxID=1463598 RepID=A0ABW4R4Q5_9RHOB
MTAITTGDRSRSYQLNLANAQLKRGLDVLTREVATGIKSDIGAHLGGNLMQFGALENRLTTISAQQSSLAEGALIAQAMQASFTNMQDITVRHAPGLIDVGNSSSPQSVQMVTQAAAAELDVVIGQLNVEVAGRHVFGGTRSDAPPIVGKTEFLSALRSVTSGLATVDDVVSAIDDWFDAPAGSSGFLDMAFRGDSSSYLSQQVSSTVTVAFPFTAASANIKNLLKGLAVASLISDGSLGLGHAAEAQLAAESGRMIMNAGTGIIEQQGKLGAIEEHIEKASRRNEAEETSLKIARTTLIGTDPFETAQQLTTVQTQLESVYAVTARLSRLSLANYLK